MYSRLALPAALLLLASSGAADDKPRIKPPDPVALLNLNSPDALAGNLRGYLVRNLPDPLYEASPGWGTTRYVTRGVEWRGQGLGVHPERQKSHKNDGTWRKIRVVAENPADTLALDLRDVAFPEPGTMTFGVYLALDLKVHYDRQEWDRGRKLYDGSARARLRAKVALSGKATLRFETPPGGRLPDAVAQFQVTGARLTYDNFVLEHVGGLGGEMAKVVGDAGHGVLNRWHPSLERDLLARAEEAVVKAGATREVRVNLINLLTKKAKKP